MTCEAALPLDTPDTIEKRLSVVEDALRLHLHVLHRQDAELLQWLLNLRDRVDRLEPDRGVGRIGSSTATPPT